jgi:DNA-binding MarR family transcriptional regulator
MMSRFERFSYAIFGISHHWHKISGDEMKKYGLKGTYAVYLITMYRCKDGITAAQLCEMCNRDKADVSRAISAMEKQGLVKKEGVNQNLYRAQIKLTDEGLAAAEKVQKRASLAVEIAGKDLTDEKRSTFYEALELIASNMQILSEKGLPDDESN